MDLDPKVFRQMVKDVARSVSSQYPSYIERLETEQILWLWLLEKRASVLRTIEDDPDNWVRKIASTMRKVAFDHCTKEKAAIEGYAPEGAYIYDLNTIKSMLTDMFTSGIYGTKPDRDDIIDLKNSLSGMPADTVRLLYFQYGQQCTMEVIAGEFGIGTEAAKKRAQRALAALQRALGVKEAPGVHPADRRAVRSNAAARAAVSNQWEG